MTNAALIGACRHIVWMRTTYENTNTVTAIASGSMSNLAPPMAMNNRPMAQPTSELMIRARNVNTACFINGSLVATTELLSIA